jgi:hypothetical protein
MITGWCSNRREQYILSFRQLLWKQRGFYPYTLNFLLSSNGSMDAFLIKYYWPPNTLPTGTMVGDIICPSETAQLTFNALTGTSPFTLLYSDGTNILLRQMFKAVFHLMYRLIQL